MSRVAPPAVHTTQCHFSIAVTRFKGVPLGANTSLHCRMMQFSTINNFAPPVDSIRKLYALQITVKMTVILLFTNFKKSLSFHYFRTLHLANNQPSVAAFSWLPPTGSGTHCQTMSSRHHPSTHSSNI